MIYLVGGISLFVISLVMSDWRRGLLTLLVIGVLQDVLRKLTPGAPASFILWTGSLFAVVMLVAYGRGAIKGLRPLYLHDARLEKSWIWFILVVLLQAGNALVRWGNPLISVLGVVFYLGPVAALLVGAAYVRSEQQIERFLKTYVLIMVPAALTVYLSAEFADQWPVLRDVGTFTGTQLVIYDAGTVLVSHPGVFRVGELAAWHAATSIAFLSVLGMRYPSLVFRLFIGVLAVALVGAIILTGRRKMLMALPIFFSFQWVLLILLHRGLTRRTGALLTMVLAGALAFSFLGHEEQVTRGSYYAQRGESVFESTDERLQTTQNLVISAWYRSGGIGVGAGVAGQGMRFAGDSGGAQYAVGGSAESGLGMIIVELGAPGVVVMLWLLFNLASRIWKGLRMLRFVNERLLVYAVSFVALLLANLATFGVATQLYSDHVVLIVLGLVAGMLFALVNAGIEQYHAQVRLRWVNRMLGQSGPGPSRLAGPLPDA